MSEIEFETYDESIAKRMLESGSQVGGLPAYLGVKIVEFGPGRLRAELAVRDELLTPFGNMHGGVMAALVDHVLGVVAYPLMRRGQWAATTEFKLNYLTAVSGGTLVAESEVISFTRSTAIVRIEVRNDGRLACVAQGTLLVRDPRPRA